MDSVREQIEAALQRPKIHKDTVYGILKQIADAIEPPAPAPVKVAAPAPAPVKVAAPAPPAPPAPAPVPETPKKKVVKRVVKKKVVESKE